MKRSKFFSQLSAKNSNLDVKKISTLGVKTISNRLSILLPATGILIACVCATYVAQAIAQQIELKNVPLPPNPPKVSTFAPADDLSNQLRDYIKEIEESLADEQEYNDSQEKIARCTNTLAAIALCLGMHDQDNEYKERAPGLIKAAQKMAAARDYQSAKKALENVKQAAERKIHTQAELKWAKVASLPELMKQVPNINTKLKRSLRGKKFKSKAKETAGYTATIAAIAQGSLADISKAKNAQQAKLWFDYMGRMRDDSGELNAAIHEGNEAAAKIALKKLAKSCDQCHALFHPEAVISE
ncbi:MAG: hypothetical protein ACWGMZ_06630 [Thermoguttaceae bacterium]